MQMKRKTCQEHNKNLSNVKRKPSGMSGNKWNSYLDELKRLGKYNGEIYTKTRTRIDEIFEINQEMKEHDY
jgi:hypothetical protein